MTLFNNFQTENVMCDACNSEEIQDTCYEYVCKGCGLVLEIHKFVFHSPYKKSSIQNYKMEEKTIGFRNERCTTPYSAKWNYLNKLNSQLPYERRVLKVALEEATRIFSCLELPKSYIKIIIEKFKQIYIELEPNTKYRSPEKLIPLIIYFTLKLNNVSIRQYRLLEVSKITKRDFNSFVLQILRFFPEYSKRNRIAYIIQNLFELVEHFKLNLSLFFQTKEILLRLWEDIKNTTDEIITGLVSSISIMCSNNGELRINRICDYLGIRMSTLEYQIKKKIIKKYRVSGFKTLVKSSDIIKNLIVRTIFSETSPEVVEIRLGTAQEVYNQHNNIECYLFAIKTETNKILYISFRKITTSSKRKPQRSKIIIVELELIMLKISKGPPL